MTITAEPPPRTLPQYRYQASHLSRSPLTSELSVVGTMHDRFDEILTEEGLDFVCRLHGQFAGRRAELLAVRRSRSDQGPGHPFRFLPETAAIREDRPGESRRSPRTVDRRCEITNANPKMTIGALNSGARWMADFEDATSPTWFNIIDGQLNLYDAIRRQIDFATPTAGIRTRPRAGDDHGAAARWHLTEHHLVMDGQPIPAAFVDFGLFFFHNARP